MHTPSPVSIPRHIILFGRPGSGKSSLAEYLVRDEGYLPVRTGEMLREAVRAGGETAERIEAFLKRGDLVPDQMIFDLLEARLDRPAERKLLFDGFPRTVRQFELLEAFERKLGFAIDCFLEIRLSRETAIRRMTGRRVCARCGATYHLLTKPPKVAETCDLDGERLSTRSDDSEAVIAFRQDVYDRNVPPIIERVLAVSPGLYRGVEGDQSPAAVYAETRRVLGLDPING